LLGFSLSIFILIYSPEYLFYMLCILGCLLPMFLANALSVVLYLGKFMDIRDSDILSFFYVLYLPFYYLCCCFAWQTKEEKKKDSSVVPVSASQENAEKDKNRHGSTSSIPIAEEIAAFTTDVVYVSASNRSNKHRFRSGKSHHYSSESEEKEDMEDLESENEISFPTVNLHADDNSSVDDIEKGINKKRQSSHSDESEEEDSSAKFEEEFQSFSSDEHEEEEEEDQLEFNENDDHTQSESDDEDKEHSLEHSHSSDSMKDSSYQSHSSSSASSVASSHQSHHSSDDDDELLVYDSSPDPSQKLSWKIRK
jgi:hypothetical protein